MTSQALHIRHLYARAGFGISYSELKKAANLSVEEAVATLFKDSFENSPISLVENSIAEYTIELLQKRMKGKKPSQEDKKAFKTLLKQSRMEARELNIHWISQMKSSKAALREKMTLFWHGHFACRSNNAFYLQQLNNIHRKHALGNFRDMLIEVSKSPTMLQFLNNQQNKKTHPNENFARELMELFTLGRDQYTEKDIKEAARAFTGWTFRRDTGEFFFRKKDHDTGTKTFLGRTGNFEGEAIIDIILEEKQTAYFICEKLYRFFVNHTPDAASIEALAQVFTNNKYDIGKTVKKMLTAPWFYDEKNRGTMIKSPIDFMVGLNKTFNLHYADERFMLLIQRALGQILFYPPNVSGWAAGRTWIDSNTLMNRLLIPATLICAGQIELAGNPDPEEEVLIALNEKFSNRLRQNINVTVAWEPYLKDIAKVQSKADLIDYLLASGLTNEKQVLLSELGTDNLKEITIQMVSLPEYQMT